MILRYGFEQLDLYRIYADTAEFNEPAQRLLARCGFMQEGCEREAIYTAGRRWNRMRYGVLRDECLRLIGSTQGA